MSGPAVTIALPYSRLAAEYDATLGKPFLWQTVNAFERLVKRYGINFNSAADIGCGTGLFARHLNISRGVPVYAVDLSAPMLQMAKRNCCGTNVVLLNQDIRRLLLPRKVDLVTANFDTLNHIVRLDHLRQTLRRVFENLNPGGHFIFDVVTDCLALGRRAYVRQFRSEFRRVTQSVRLDPLRKLVSIFVSIRSPNMCRPVIERHRERAYSAAELGKGLHETGFVVRGVHDSTTLATATGCPSRIVLVAHKKR